LKKKLISIALTFVLIITLTPISTFSASADITGGSDNLTKALNAALATDEDLRRALERELSVLGGRQPAGALLFTCNGRGSRMFAKPDHDAGLLAQMLGHIPVAGFFCAGEIGPVGGQNFLHGFTASVAVFPDTGPA
jgi:small ligand-binding sensory domain FIST